MSQKALFEFEYWPKNLTFKVQSLTQTGSVPQASNARLSPLPPEPVAFDRDVTVDIPLGNSKVSFGGLSSKFANLLLRRSWK